jgi:acyl-CoA synthetase (AMP-forming)/AMP-acid ligase II
VIAYVAAAKLGAVTAGVNPVLAPPEQERLTALADPTVVLTDGGEIEELAAYGTRALDCGSAEIAGPLPPDDSRPVAIVFTSGTTRHAEGRGLHGVPVAGRHQDRHGRCVGAAGR